MVILAIAAVVAAVVVGVKALSTALKESGKDADKNFPAKPVCKTKEPCPLQAKKVLTIAWAEADAWCSETAHLYGTTENYTDGEKLALKVKDADDGSGVANFDESVSGNAFNHPWEIKDYLPRKNGAHYVEQTRLDGSTSGKTTPKPLLVHFIPTLPKTHYSAGHSHFDLDVEDYVIHITSEIKYVKGWSAEVVKLDANVPAATGGLLDGKLTWNGYRWMKRVAGKRKYWDGTAWQDIPATLNLDDPLNDSLYFGVGFYLSGTNYTCQYGGDWVEAFTDWNIDAADKQKRIKEWKENADTTWTGKFDIKRKECKSSNKQCCRYKTEAKITFTKEGTFSAGYLVIADGNVRSNDSLWFLGEPRVAVAAHEFGHHLGNPDEYTGAEVETTLNDDGAVNGIDADSIMGQNLTKVKKRHYRTICAHLASMVATKTGKSYNYEAVPK